MELQLLLGATVAAALFALTVGLRLFLSGRRDARWIGVAGPNSKPRNEWEAARTASRADARPVAVDPEREYERDWRIQALFCPTCGVRNDAGYRYCGECVGRLH